jgi:hypothetical protein
MPFVWLGVRPGLAILIPFLLLVIYFLQYSARDVLEYSDKFLAFLCLLLFLVAEHLPMNFGTASASQQFP